MFKTTAIGLTCFLLGLAGGLGAVGHSQTLRLEVGLGIADHGLAPEGSWWYDGFKTENKLAVGMYTAGLLWTPIKRGDWLIGARAGYADLGTTRSQNDFPFFEYGGAADARVNQNCNRATLEGCTGRYSGEGTTRGWYFGPVVEHDFGAGVAIGGEIGAYHYKSTWRASNLLGVDGEETFQPWGHGDGMFWDNARGDHWTWYAGAQARWHYVYLNVRRYASVHAARTDLNHEFVGMTSGPVWTAMVGLSIPLN